MSAHNGKVLTADQLNQLESLGPDRAWSLSNGIALEMISHWGTDMASPYESELKGIEDWLNADTDRPTASQIVTAIIAVLPTDIDRATFISKLESAISS